MTIEVELLDNLELEASHFSRRIPRSSLGFQDLAGSYKIISEHKQKYSEEDFHKKKSTFITANDFAKQEKEEDFRSKLLDIKRNSPLRLQEENEKHMLYSLKDMKRDLRLNILCDIDIDEYAVFSSLDVIYENIYKLVLVLFRKKITSFTFEEIRMKYYKYFIPEEFGKLEYELEKYYKYEDQRSHLSIIDSYSDRFSNKKTTNPENLIWTGSFQEFIEFFEPIIERREILYKGENDKYVIYSYLLNNIFIKNEPGKTIDDISEILKIEVMYPLTETEKCKLTWNGSTKEFANVFKTKINRAEYDKSTFLYHGVNTLSGKNGHIDHLAPV